LYATEILLWGAVVSFLIWFIRTRKIFSSEYRIDFHWTKDRLFVLSLLVFILYSFCSIFWSLFPSVAFQHSFFFMETFLLFLILYLGPFKWQTAVQWFIAGAFIQSALAVFQFLTQSTFAFKWLGLVSHPVMESGTSVIASEEIGRVMRAYGAFSHPNVLGGYLVTSIILTTLLLWQNKKFHSIWYGVVALQLAGLFFTFSRSAWIACAVWFCGLLVYWFFHQKKDLTMRWVPRLCVFVVAFFMLLTFHSWDIVQTRFAHVSSHEIRSTQERVGGIQEAFNLLKQSPWIGVGVGNYTAAAYELDPSNEGYEYQPVHNVPLLLLTELGIIGMIFAVFALIRLLMVMSPDNVKKPYPFLFILGIIFGVYFVLSSFDHYLYSSHGGLLFGFASLALVLRFFAQVFPSLSKGVVTR